MCTIQRAPRMRVISVYFHLNVHKLYDGLIRLLADHDFTVRCIQVDTRPLDGTFNCVREVSLAQVYKLYIVMCMFMWLCPH